MADDLTTATLAAIDAELAERMEMHRCPERCRLAAVYRIRGQFVWVTFSRRQPQAALDRPTGPLTLQCKHGFHEVEFRS